MMQGFSGGALLVTGQAIIFLAYPRSHQPILQALFAMGSVVAPATIAPALQGWLLDSQSWTWIFFSVVPLALVAAGLLVIADGPRQAATVRRPFDWIGFSLISVALFSFTYVLSQGSRWDWFEEPRIIWLTVIGAVALLAFLGQQVIVKGRGLVDFTSFRSEDFCFAFIVSFVAGAALFGSAFLIPSFAVSVLAFTPTDAGQLLLPSGAVFIGTLLVAAFLMQVRGVPPVATVPVGILMIMIAMWMLSGSASESGADDMMAAILLRGLGLGCLFLSITLIAFTNLNNHNRASGIGLFNTGRQLGGLMGVAGLQTLIDHHVVGNAAVLGANVTAGVPAVSERLTTTAAMFAAKGMDAVAAGRAATSLLGRVVIGQSTVIAFDTAFNAVALLFVFAAPMLVAIKIGLARYAKMRAARQPVPGIRHMRHAMPKSARLDNEAEEAAADSAKAGSAEFVYRRASARSAAP
jgi:MFS transporter, DHA2 family, multidrug resistance protein